MFQVSYYLDCNASMNSSDLALTFGETSLTWSELDAAASDVAKALIACGVTTGDIVAYHFPNCINGILLFWGCQKIGAGAFPLNTLLSASELSKVLNLVECKLLFYHVSAKSTFEKFTQLAHSTSTITGAVISGDSVDFVDFTSVPNCSTWDSFVKAGRSVSTDTLKTIEDAVGPNDPSIVLLTGGTTSLPKAVYRTQQVTKDYMTMLAVENQNCRTKETILTTSALFHTAGLTLMLKAAILKAHFIVVDKFNDTKTFKDIVDNNVTQLLLVPPALYGRLLAANTGATCETVKEAQCTGGSVSINDILGVEKLFPNALFKSSYGSTETCGPLGAVLSVDMFKENPDLLGTVGKPNFSCKVKLLDSDGNVITTPNTPGELYVQEPMLFNGYLHNDELNAQVLKDGWYKTDDILQFNEDGYWFFMGRTVDMIKTGGENVYSVEVEQVVNHYPDVLECAAIGVPDEKFGEAIGVCIIMKKGEEFDIDEFKQYTKQNMASFRKPRYVAIVDHLPHTASGKLKRSDLYSEFRSSFISLYQ